MFCLRFPIGWSELGVIATFFGAVAAFCTVLVALCANRKATKQLESALKMQEQSKNVGLYKERIELVQAFQSGIPVFEPSVKILFNDEIYMHYKIWMGYRADGDRAANGENYLVFKLGGNEERRAEIKERMAKADSDADTERELILQLMRKYIEASIQPVYMKKGKPERVN